MRTVSPLRLTMTYWPKFALFFEVFAHRRLQRTRAAYGCFREFRSVISRILFLTVKIRPQMNTD